MILKRVLKTWAFHVSIVMLEFALILLWGCYLSMNRQASLWKKGGYRLHISHRMVEVGMSPSPTPLLKQVSLELRTVFRRFLNISIDGDFTTSLGNLCQCSVALTIKKKSFLMFLGNLLCSNLCPLTLILSLGNNWEESGSLFFVPFLQVFRWISSLVWPWLSCPGDQDCRGGLIRAEQSKITSVGLLGVFLLVQPRMPSLAFFVQGCLMFTLVSSGTPRPFSAKLLCSHLAPSMCCWTSWPSQSIFSPPHSLLSWLRLTSSASLGGSCSVKASLSQDRQTDRQYPLLSSLTPGLSLHTVTET